MKILSGKCRVWRSIPIEMKSTEWDETKSTFHKINYSNNCFLESSGKKTKVLRWKQEDRVEFLWATSDDGSDFRCVTLWANTSFDFFPTFSTSAYTFLSVVETQNNFFQHPRLCSEKTKRKNHQLIHKVESNLKKGLKEANSSDSFSTIIY